MLCLSDHSGTQLITKLEQKFNFLHGWAQQRGASYSVILLGLSIALGEKPLYLSRLCFRHIASLGGSAYYIYVIFFI